MAWLAWAGRLFQAASVATPFIRISAMRPAGARSRAATAVTDVYLRAEPSCRLDDRVQMIEILLERGAALQGRGGDIGRVWCARGRLSKNYAAQITPETMAPKPQLGRDWLIPL
jgi:hypothetical protein